MSSAAHKNRPLPPRAARLREARERHFKEAAPFARSINVPEVTYRAHESGGRDYDEETAKKYASALNVSWIWLFLGEGSMDVADRNVKTTETFSFQPIPSKPLSHGDKDLRVLGVAVGSREGFFDLNGQVAEMTYRPASLVGVPDAYALYVVGDSVAPRYRHGEMIWVHPRRRPSISDYVVVQLQPERDGDSIPALIGELVKWDSTRLIIRKHQPRDHDIEFPAPKVLAVHLIEQGGRAP